MDEKQHDEHAGKGGSYRRDPVTGRRELVERAGQPALDPKPAPQPAAESVKPAKKGAGNA